MALSAGSASPTTDADLEQPVRRTGRNLWISCLVLAFAGFAPVLFVAESVEGDAVGGTWRWAFLLTAVVGVRLAWLIATAPRRVFEIVFWLFTYAFMGLAPLVQLRTGIYPGTTPDIDTRLNGIALAIVAVGCGAFALGSALGSRPGHRYSFEHRTRISPHRLAIVTAFALLVAAYYVSAIGIGALVGTRDARGLLEDASWPNFTVAAVVRACATLTLVVCFAALVRLRKERRIQGRQGPSIWYAVLVAVVLLAVINPISTPRYVFGTAVLAMAASVGALANDRRARVLLLSLAVGLLIVFPYADFARNDNQQGPIVTGGPTQSLTTADFDAFDQVNNAVAYTDAEGHADGGQILGAAFFWVPRAIWPDKPINTGELLGEFRAYATVNLSASVWTELWIDGGWPFVIAGMAGLGWVLRRADERAIAQPVNLQPGVLAGILPFYMIIVLRGSLLQAMAGLAVIVCSGLLVTTRVPMSESARERHQSASV